MSDARPTYNTLQHDTARITEAICQREAQEAAHAPVATVSYGETASRVCWTALPGRAPAALPPPPLRRLMALGLRSKGKCCAPPAESMPVTDIVRNARHRAACVQGRWHVAQTRWAPRMMSPTNHITHTHTHIHIHRHRQTDRQTDTHTHTHAHAMVNSIDGCIALD